MRISNLNASQQALSPVSTLEMGLFVVNKQYLEKGEFIMAIIEWHQPVKTKKGEYRYESRDGNYSVIVVASGFALIFKNPELNNGRGGDDPIGQYKTFMAANKEAINHSQGNPTSRPKPSPKCKIDHRSQQQRADDLARHLNLRRYSPFTDAQIDQFREQVEAAYPNIYKDIKS